MRTAYFKTKFLTQLTVAIEQTYLKSIRGSGLDFVRARHFLYRYYIVKQDPASWNLLVSTSQSRTQESVNQLLTVSRQKEYPNQLDYVYERLRTGFYLHLFNLRLFPFSDIEISRIKQRLFADDNYWSAHTYRAICIVFYLYFQQQIDWIAAAEVKFAEVFSSRKTGDIRNYLYGLTHFIICGANFYQQPPPAKYQKYLAEIQRKKNDIKPEWIDLIMEVALAGKFYGLNVWPAAEIENLIKPRVIQDNGLTYIAGIAADLNHSEHVNALLILLVNDWRFPVSRRRPISCFPYSNILENLRMLLLL